MFANEDVRQTAGLQQHEAVDTDERKEEKHKDDPMDVDALNKGAGKGKSKGKGKKSKGKGKPSNAENSNWQKGLDRKRWDTMGIRRNNV